MIHADDCFSYELPPERIAQRPVHPYDAAKMLIVSRSAGPLTDSVFSRFHELVRPGDLVIFNDTKVIPARLFGTIGAGARVELLLLRQLNERRWSALGKPLKKLTTGTSVEISGGLRASVVSRTGEMEIEVELIAPGGRDVRDLLHEAGSMPVPPYIRRGEGDEQDKTDYQSIFARVEGSVAAPTASLHFTPELMQRIKEAGAAIESLTLHVGPASFLPIRRHGNPELIPPGKERWNFKPELLETIGRIKRSGGRVIAVGTTVVRALESMMRAERNAGGENETELFITPGFEWRAVDVLVTNFHQPNTTHLLLVEALTGRALLEKSYRHALDQGYRFLSYGDGMVILP